MVSFYPGVFIPYGFIPWRGMGSAVYPATLDKIFAAAGHAISLLHRFPIILGVEGGDGLGQVCCFFAEILFEYDAILADRKRHHS